MYPLKLDALLGYYNFPYSRSHMYGTELMISWPFSCLEARNAEQKKKYTKTKEWKQDPDRAASGAVSWSIFDVPKEERGQCLSWFSTASCANGNLIQSHLLHSLPMPLFHWPLIFGDMLPLTVQPSSPVAWSNKCSCSTLYLWAKILIHYLEVCKYTYHM